VVPACFPAECAPAVARWAQECSVARAVDFRSALAGLREDDLPQDASVARREDALPAVASIDSLRDDCWAQVGSPADGSLLVGYSVAPRMVDLRVDDSCPGGLIPDDYSVVRPMDAPRPVAWDGSCRDDCWARADSRVADFLRADWSAARREVGSLAGDLPPGDCQAWADSSWDDSVVADSWARVDSPQAFLPADSLPPEYLDGPWWA
jgi:hypothetical protein